MYAICIRRNVKCLALYILQNAVVHWNDKLGHI